MRRRDLMLLAGVAILTSPIARAQQTERMRRVGYLTPVTGSPDDLLGVRQTRALIAGLRDWVGLTAATSSSNIVFRGADTTAPVTTPKNWFRSTQMLSS